jgi:hypothetical protein
MFQNKKPFSMVQEPIGNVINSKSSLGSTLPISIQVNEPV